MTQSTRFRSHDAYSADDHVHVDAERDCIIRSFGHCQVIQLPRLGRMLQILAEPPLGRLSEIIIRHDGSSQSP